MFDRFEKNEIDKTFFKVKLFEKEGADLMWKQEFVAEFEVYVYERKYETDDFLKMFAFNTTMDEVPYVQRK